MENFLTSSTNLIKSKGKIVYWDLPKIRLVVEIDKEIPRYYRSLIPKSISQHGQIPMYAPHISVIRKEIPPDMTNWKKYSGQSVDFEYDPYIHIDEKYCWMSCYSSNLEAIRVELGLQRHRFMTENPCFHTTIMNFKKG